MSHGGWEGVLVYAEVYVSFLQYNNTVTLNSPLRQRHPLNIAGKQSQAFNNAHTLMASTSFAILYLNFSIPTNANLFGCSPLHHLGVGVS